MLKNSQYVIYAYGIAGGAIAIYVAALFFRLRKIRKKLTELEDKE